MLYEKPLPQPNEDTKPFWDACKKHELRFQKCFSCGCVRWPSSIVCPQCHSRDAAWIKSSGKGKVYTFTIFHKVYHKGFADDVPYVVAIVELEEGPHFLTNIVDCPPGEVYCDMPVEVIWEDVADFSLPKFRPLRG